MTLLKKLEIFLILLFATISCNNSENKTLINGFYEENEKGISYKLPNDTSIIIKVNNKPIINFNDFESVVFDKDPINNSSIIFIKLDKIASDVLLKASERNINKRLPLIFDNEILIAPVIKSKIYNGLLQITGIDDKTSKKLIENLKQQNIKVEVKKNLFDVFDKYLENAK